MFARIKNFFAESRQEFRHVNWPTRQEAMRLTAIVIVMAVGISLFLGLFDYIFADVIKAIVAG
ncbi:MAG TPA: preprotein translocase subunit SecE [Candidatus Paceibacterota bacterium]|jgi:preprotein translocase subunit SecE|nr:preprotein translocase subunit SecE [Candidatus Paceibacterota bacterium]